MTDVFGVPLTHLVEEFKLTVAYESSDYKNIRVTVEDVSRPGLQLAGYFDHFEPMRLQVLGNVEISYLHKLPYEQQRVIFDRLFSYKIPALIISRDMEPGSACLEMARKHDITILRCMETTSYIVSSLISSLIIFLCAFVGFFKFYMQEKLRKHDEKVAAAAQTATNEEGGNE